MARRSRELRESADELSCPRIDIIDRFYEPREYNRLDRAPPYPAISRSPFDSSLPPSPSATGNKFTLFCTIQAVIFPAITPMRIQ